MPRKVRQLIGDLTKAGFVDRGGKGSHRNFTHPKLTRPITISGIPATMRDTTKSEPSAELSGSRNDDRP